MEVPLPQIVMAVAAGVCLHAAIMQGMVGFWRRRRDRVRIAFACTALAVTVGALALVGMYSVHDAQQHVALMKWVFFPASVAFTVSAVWLVAFYTAVLPRRFLYVLSAAFGAIVAIDLVLPTGILHAAVGEVHEVGVAGSSIMVMSGTSPTTFNIAAETLTVVACLFVAYAPYELWRRGDARRARYAAIMVALLVVTAVLDDLADHGRVSSLYFSQVCFALIVVAVSIGLRRESLHDESQLRAARMQLESMLDARVEDLDRALDLVAQERSEREAAQVALRRRVVELDSLQHLAQRLETRSGLAGALEDATVVVARLFDAVSATIHLTTEESDPALGESIEFAETFGLRDPEQARDGLEDATPAGPHGRARDAVRQALWLRQPVVRDGDGGGGPLLAVPLTARSDIVGALVVERHSGDPAFSGPERRLAKTAGDSIAAAVQLERHHRDEMRRATEDERQRLARDLHDSVTQSLYAASLLSDALPSLWQRDPEAGELNLARMDRLVRGALAEMRSLLFELRPASLEAASLDTLLARLAESLEGRAQIPVTVGVPPALELPGGVKLALYRIAQESLSNIERHAGAAHVAVTVAWDGATVGLTVHDDGRGFDPAAVAADHHGLRIMQERLERVGGSLTVSSTPGSGTTVHAYWPASD